MVNSAAVFSPFSAGTFWLIPPLFAAIPLKICDFARAIRQIHVFSQFGRFSLFLPISLCFLEKGQFRIPLHFSGKRHCLVVTPPRVQVAIWCLQFLCRIGDDIQSPFRPHREEAEGEPSRALRTSAPEGGGTGPSFGARLE